MSAKHPPAHAPAEAAPSAKPSLMGRVLGLPMWGLKHPIKAILFSSPLLFAMIGLIAAYSLGYFQTPEIIPPSLNAAFQELDAGNLVDARQIATELRSDPENSYSTIGDAMYVLGAIMSEDAAKHYKPQEKQLLYLIAARYLEESRLRGFPEGREAAGLLLLGTAWQQAGRPASAIPILKEALPLNPDQEGEIHRLLADASLQLQPPQIDAAIEHNSLYLKQTTLSPSDQQQGWLLQTRILLTQPDFTAARDALAQIPPNSAARRQAMILATWLMDRELASLGNQTGAAPVEGKLRADGSSLARAQFAKKLDELRELYASEGSTLQLAAQAQLMQGICLERMGDLRAALTQYGRTRRLHFGTPEALVAELREANLQRVEQHSDVALGLYQRLLGDAGSRESYVNPWLPLPELTANLAAAFQDYLADQDYNRAVQLAGSLPPLLDEVTALQWQTQAQVAWAESLANKAQGESLAAADVTRAEVRQHYREAGASFEKLAELRIATRNYLDDLQASANAYLAGHGYEQAARMYRLFLKQEPQRGQPEALTGLGESLVTLGQLDAALDVLDHCRKKYPKHPATYHARLHASQALEEAGKVAEARQMLMDNLYNFALEPASTDWRDSLFALGALNFREAQQLETQSRKLGVDELDLEQKKPGLAQLEISHDAFQEAIRVLGEAVARYANTPEALSARYRLAEAYRLSAKFPRKKLETVAVETTRATLYRQMQSELQAALKEFNQLIAALNDEQETSARNQIEQTILRNAYFGRADTLFDLEQYEQAISAYSAATNRYQHEPEALEAYVRIASCYRRLNKATEARGTLQQAKVVLSRLRPDANFTKTTPYSREEWTKLLDWLVSL